MSERAFTAGQLAVIARSHGHALVSAVAGSGKTTVLGERIARLVNADEDPGQFAEHERGEEHSG